MSKYLRIVCICVICLFVVEKAEILYPPVWSSNTDNSFNWQFFCNVKFRTVASWVSGSKRWTQSCRQDILEWKPQSDRIHSLPQNSNKINLHKRRIRRKTTNCRDNFIYIVKWAEKCTALTFKTKMKLSSVYNADQWEAVCVPSMNDP